MKKIFNIVLIFIFLIPTFSVPDVVNAQTLGDLRIKQTVTYKQLRIQLINYMLIWLI